MFKVCSLSVKETEVV